MDFSKQYFITAFVKNIEEYFLRNYNEIYIIKNTSAIGHSADNHWFEVKNFL